MSNYPPGVTGRELHIAGSDWEGTVSRDCEANDVVIRVVTSYPDSERSIKTIEDALNFGESFSRSGVGAIRRLKSNIKELELSECPFSGKVTAWTYRETLHWTCPMCGTEKEEYVDEYLDYYDE